MSGSDHCKNQLEKFVHPPYSVLAREMQIANNNNDYMTFVMRKYWYGQVAVEHSHSPLVMPVQCACLVWLKLHYTPYLYYKCFMVSYFYYIIYIILVGWPYTSYLFHLFY